MNKSAAMNYLIVIILCALWLLIFKSSDCELLDSPFGFVAGCMNHGINWNIFLAPSGLLLMLLLPVAIIHLFLTSGKLLSTLMIKRIFSWLHLSLEEREARLMSDPTYALLRREVTRVGHLYEHKTLSELQRTDEELSFSETIDGIIITFNCHCVDQLKNGDVVFCIDACAEPNHSGQQPSYQFCKTASGEVYY